MASPLKLISWNVNGIRAMAQKNVWPEIIALNPDVICLQETKAEATQFPSIDLNDYLFQYSSSAEKKGYSGTALFSKTEPLHVSYALPSTTDHPAEGRIITAEFPHYFLVNVYVPNSQDALRRLDYRINHWDADLHKYLQSLHQTKPVVLCGDLNVAHQAIDLANPKTNRKNAGFTDEERNSFSQLLDNGFIDTFRHLNPEREKVYSWWSYRAGARKRNVGWRIDYFVTSTSLANSLDNANIHSDILGSDHCPVSLQLKPF